MIRNVKGDASNFGNNNFGIIGDGNIVYNGADPLLEKSVLGAAYDAEERRPASVCIPGTRQLIMDELKQWITNRDDKRICWLSGVAGSGKSAIAQSFAEVCASQNRLAASFFFSHTRSAASSFFPTVACQLMESVPSVIGSIRSALVATPSIPRKTLRIQFDRLVIKPLLTLPQPLTSAMIVVVDSLEECKDADSAKEIVSLLAEALQQSQLPLRVLITSRPEKHIQAKFRDPKIRAITRSISLRDYDAQADIRTSLRYGFARIRDEHGIPGPWPSEDNIEILVEKSAGLFIFTATVLRFVSDSHGCPKKRIQLLTSEPTRTSPSEYSELDRFYKHILLSHPNVREGQSFVNIVVLLFSPLSVLDLGRLFRWDPQDVYRTLLPLNAILILPEDDRKPIRAFHASLCDFLTDGKRSGDFYVDGAKLHAKVAKFCLSLMATELKRDICHIQDPSRLNSEVVISNISGALHYACRHWVSHLCEASEDNALLDQIQLFSTKLILYWLETLSLTGDMSSVVGLLRSACKRLKPPTKHLLVFTDAERFVLEFFDAINVAALHVYYSALVFIPKYSLLRKTYETELEGGPIVLEGLDKEWDSCLKTINLQSSVRSVTFSPDGTRIASGSDEEGIQLWDAATGGNLAGLEEDAVVLESVVFSPDSTRISAGSRDGDVLIWDLENGYSLSKFNAHQEAITSVAFLPDPALIVSASHDCTVRLRNIAQPDSPTIFRGHSRAVTIVVSSPNGTYIASGSADTTIQIWDVASRRLQSRLTHRKGISALRFSSDGSRIASATANGVLLWDVLTGNCLIDREYPRIVNPYVPEVIFSSIRPWASKWPSFSKPLGLNLQSKAPMAFSSDLTRVAFAESLHEIAVAEFIPIPERLSRIMASPSELKSIEPTRLPGHRSDITAMSFSPDSFRLVSASADKTIRFWDSHADSESLSAVSCNLRVLCSPDGDYVIMRRSYRRESSLLKVTLGRAVTVKSKYTRAVNVDAALFSPNSSTLATWSPQDTFITLVTTSTGSLLRKLQSQGDITVVKFSHDGAYIAAGSECCRVVVWDVRNGSVVTVFTGSGPITSIAFSSDGVRIASGSEDSVICVWIATTGRLLETLTGHRSKITSIAFSPDGTRLASGSQDGSVFLWTASHCSVVELEDGIHSVMFSSDGTHITCCSGDTTVSVLEATVDSLAVISQSPPGTIFDYYSHSNYILQPDGWVFRGTKRLCWVPHRYRAFTSKAFSAQGDILVMLPNFAAFLEVTPVIVDFTYSPGLSSKQ